MQGSSPFAGLHYLNVSVTSNEYKELMLEWKGEREGKGNRVIKQSNVRDRRGRGDVTGTEKKYLQLPFAHDNVCTPRHS